LIPLLRTLEQVDTALALAPELGLREVELDFMELVGLGKAVARVRAAGLRVIIATPRVQKPGEEGYDRRFESLLPDGILARHLGALEHFRAGKEEIAREMSTAGANYDAPPGLSTLRRQLARRAVLTGLPLREDDFVVCGKRRPVGSTRGQNHCDDGMNNRISAAFMN
jgi:DNA-binding transcriptional MocR family regulator